MGIALPWRSGLAFKLCALLYPQLALFIGISRDRSSEANRVVIDSQGNSVVHYEVTAADVPMLMAGLKAQMRLMFESGCDVLFPMHETVSWFVRDQAQSPEEQAQIAALRKRDADVRAHERAHQMAAGGLAGGATYTYQRGPDGQLYAVGGEVQITVGPGRTPEETLQRARTVRSAALAPAEPSGPDRAVAAAAASMEAQALQEINARDSEASRGDRRTEAYEAMSRSGEAKPEGRSLDVVA
jgi:hypothetical protein